MFYRNVNLIFDCYFFLYTTIYCFICVNVTHYTYIVSFWNWLWNKYFHSHFPRDLCISAWDHKHIEIHRENRVYYCVWKCMNCWLASLSYTLPLEIVGTEGWEWNQLGKAVKKDIAQQSMVTGHLHEGKRLSCSEA